MSLGVRRSPSNPSDPCPFGEVPDTRALAFDRTFSVIEALQSFLGVLQVGCLLVLLELCGKRVLLILVFLGSSLLSCRTDRERKSIGVCLLAGGLIKAVLQTIFLSVSVYNLEC